MKAQAADRGFIYTELLAAITIVAMAAGWLLHSSGSLRNSLCRMQVRTASAVFASELRSLQRNAMFKENGIALKLRIDSSGKGYIVYRGLNPVKKLNMEKIGCSGVYFARKITAAAFSTGGSPVSSGSYELRHQLLDSFSCTVTVQPVTGRVIINEKK